MSEGFLNAPVAAQAGLTDVHGRRVNYLRLSVTDRCNLRCSYCMPAGAEPKPADSGLLSYEDLHRIACQAVALGIEKIRVTGGEPLVRPGVVGFLDGLSGIDGLREVVLTTNGTRLEEMARSLRQAGVSRLNVSLDSLRPDVFAAITRGGDLQRVLRGVAAAEEAGFPPVKINVVVMRGVNDGEVLDFAALTLAKPYTIRFIEYMPTAGEAGWKSAWVAGSEILERISSRHTLVPLCRGELAGPSRNFRILGASGSIGIITPVSNHFCGSCNRIRVTASGMAKGCLLATEAVDLKPCLQRGDDGLLRDVLRQIVADKPARHQLLSARPGQQAFGMYQIGG